MQVIEWLKRISFREKCLTSSFTRLGSRLTSICHDGKKEILCVYACMIYDHFDVSRRILDDGLEKFLMENVERNRTTKNSF